MKIEAVSSFFTLQRRLTRVAVRQTPQVASRSIIPPVPVSHSQLLTEFIHFHHGRR